VERYVISSMSLIMLSGQQQFRLYGYVVINKFLKQFNEKIRCHTAHLQTILAKSNT